MLARLPVMAVLIGVLAIGMLIPTIQAANAGEWRAGRAFLYSGLFCMFVAAGLAVLLRPPGPGERARTELGTLLLAWLVLPCFAALPLVLLTPWISTVGAWFEMVAALTTTGGTVYPAPDQVPRSVHLWRGLVGWLGGLLTLMAAYVILAPRRLGGFEVMSAAEVAAEGRSVDLRLPTAPFEMRAARALRVILPVYCLMTVVLALVFNALAEPGLAASVHAMAVVSTSGISPLEQGIAASRNFWVEAAAAAFMVLAATRLFYSRASQVGQRVTWRNDPELRLMGALVAISTLALFLRHWLGRLEEQAATGVLDGLEALWGGAFTTLSFLTTTGFHSAVWISARDWSGHANPGMILLALCAIGGGAATTAGGVKLIRAYAMLRHGARELERIAKPHSIAGAGLGSRGLRREGAMIAWAFMMLFVLGFVVTILALTLTGMEMTEALTAATAALSNTGPAYALIAEDRGGFAMLGDVEHVILAAAMLLGRIETLAVIVLLHPEGWSRYFTRAKRTGKAGPESPLSRW